MHINVWSKIQDQLDKDQQNKIIEFARKNDILVGQVKNVRVMAVCVYDKNGEIIKVSKEEFYSNKEEYISIHKNRECSPETKKKII